MDLVVLKQGIDTTTTTTTGRFLFHVIGAMDEMLADLIREGTLEDWMPHGHAAAPAAANSNSAPGK